MPPDYVKSPVQELLWPAFRDGQLQGNLGNLIDLHGLASLLPLFLIWGCGICRLDVVATQTGPRAF